jgi:hypothetical protein
LSWDESIFSLRCLLPQYLASPRKGHLDQVLRIFAYLKSHGCLFISWGSKFAPAAWEGFYPDTHKPIPAKVPESRGPEVLINCFVDANHAGNQVTLRPHTGVLIFINKAPIVWYSKRQNTVESSTFGSEFVALKIATELLQGL